MVQATANIAPKAWLKTDFVFIDVLSLQKRQINYIDNAPTIERAKNLVPSNDLYLSEEIIFEYRLKRSVVFEFPNGLVKVFHQRQLRRRFGALQNEGEFAELNGIA